MWWGKRQQTESFRLSEHVVVLTGAGISAESGLSTFRDKGGRLGTV
jgi:NAD-dependent protein deacetylases, SIR2 family